MRGSFIVAVVVLALAPARAMAQDASAAAIQNRVQQLVERIRPLQERLDKDDRLRTAEGLVGVGIAAYEASRARSGLPLGVIGAQALRLGFHHQLTFIHRQTGFSVEPAIGRGRVVITFSKTLE